MEKIIQSLINNWIRGVDTYTHNGSTWLIFTDSKRWVIELTEDKTLWYNYNFFKQIFSLTSLDVIQNQHLITKWVEDNVINKVKDTRLEINITEGEVDDIIQDGVKETFNFDENHTLSYEQGAKKLVEDAIQNGVKKTDPLHFHRPFLVKDTDNGSSDKKLGDINDIIQDGVKETIELMNELPNRVKKIIKKGVKLTQFNDNENKSWVEGVIKGGVKHTEYGDWLDGDERLDEIVENGVKETNHVDVMKFFDNKMEDTIQNGVKFTLNTEYMPKSMVVDIIENGVKSSIPRQYVGENIIDKIIDKGVIETHREICEYKHTVEHIIQTGVKETKHANKYESIGPVIKEVKINHIIDNGVKVSGTFVGGNRQKENIESVIGYGTKNPTD